MIKIFKTQSCGALQSVMPASEHDLSEFTAPALVLYDSRCARCRDVSDNTDVSKNTDAEEFVQLGAGVPRAFQSAH